MRRVIVVGLLAVGTAVILYFTLSTAIQVLSSNLTAPAVSSSTEGKYRLVLIAQQLDSPFWTDVQQGARRTAERLGADLEAWGTIGTDEQAFLNNVEIAIASKVNGIIVQGLDTDAFKQLARLKATEAGIPIITIANDVPPNDSLRKTYVGSNHYESGGMIARQLLSDMGFVGKVVLLVADRTEDFQRSRLNGIVDVLNQYPDITTEIVASGNTRDNSVAVINQVLNREPGTRAFIAVAADQAGVLVQEIKRRSRVEDYYLYSFDDSPDNIGLLQQGAVDALVAQSPQAMGEESVRLMIEWLSGHDLPLDVSGYYTDIRVMKAGRAP